MAKNKVIVRGTKQEIKRWEEVMDHYSMSQEDLNQRITRKNGFDDADKLFASHIDESSWPYSSLMFDPRPWTVILEKSARLIGSKPKGRLVPREGGDDLGAMVNNELLSFQWDDNSRLGESMIAKWQMMDQNARKYGSAFALTNWVYQKNKKGKVFYDGPDFKPINPRDVLVNPSYHYINKWFQYREWMTLDELERINNAARKDPVYKNLDLLRDALREDAKGKGDHRESQYVSKNKSMRGLTDYLGSDETFKTLEFVTERREDRWITFSPRHGVIIRDIPNPYEHGQIGVVHLKYYTLPDDIYGVSEFEPVARLIRAINAHMSAYNDRIALRLRPPLHVNPIETRMHTLQWLPEAKWLMNKPNESVQLMRQDFGEDSSFQTVYSVLVSSLLNAWGETSQGISNIDPYQPDKTATEIKDSAFNRNVRDNNNQIYLAEAIKHQTLLWHSMDQQLAFQGNAEKVKIIRIVGKDAIDYFQRKGLSDYGYSHETSMKIANGELSREDVAPGPMFPVSLGDNIVPKFQPDELGSGGDLHIEPGDMNGIYDYVPDIESMQPPSSEDVEKKMTAILGVITNPTILQMLQMENKKPKVSDLLIKMFESTKVIKDAEAYFEEIKPQNQPNTLGGGGIAGGPADQGADPTGGVGNPQGVPGGQNQPLVGGPQGQPNPGGVPLQV